jgi:hypothetical protein
MHPRRSGYAPSSRKKEGILQGNRLVCLYAVPGSGGLFFIEPLTDDGLGFVPDANDSTYAGSLNLDRVRRILLKGCQPRLPPEVRRSDRYSILIGIHVGVTRAIEVTFDALFAQGTGSNHRHRRLNCFYAVSSPEGLLDFSQGVIVGS